MTTEATAILDGGAGGSEAPAAASAAPAATVPQGGAPANGSEPGQPWYMGSGYNDDDRVYIESKGWHKGDAVPRPVFDSYRNLEKLMGAKANAVLLPKGDDPKAMDEFFGKLGRPEKPDGYSLPSTITPDVAQNMDPKAIEALKASAHKARLTNEQFGALVAERHAQEQAEAQQRESAYTAEVSRAKEALSREFGDQFGEQVARGNLAMRQLGISLEERDKLSEALGVERATRLLMQVGGSLAQHKAVGLDNGGKPGDSFVTDKARAQDRIKAIKMLGQNATGPDADFRKAMMDPGHPEHRNATAQWREWNRLANGQG